MAPKKRDFDKQCRHRSYAAERGVWSESTVFAITLESFNNRSNYSKFYATSPWIHNGIFRRSWWKGSLNFLNLPIFQDWQWQQREFVGFFCLFFLGFFLFIYLFFNFWRDGYIVRIAFLMLRMLGKIVSRFWKIIWFLIFPRKQVLQFLLIIS